MRTILLAATAVFIAGASPALAQDRWDWTGGRPGGEDFRLRGPGVPILYPELRNSMRGRAFVMRNFDRDHDRFVSVPEARAANRAFAEIAGPRRGGFDWNARDTTYVVVDRGGGPGNWDRGAMHGYGFRQTNRGAMMSMGGDVLFATDSDVLRPGALDKLRPLAAYLRANPGVRVSIDGYTDSRGTDAHNQDLSERRAASVRAALDDMGVVRARFSVTGHGEGDPVATNSTADGMRLNRRVEVTLLGRRASEF